MVSGFVEEHDVRLGEEDDREENAHLPPSGKLPAVAVEILFPETETLEDLPGSDLEGISVAGIEAGQGRLVFFEELPVSSGRLFPVRFRCDGSAGEAAGPGGDLLLAIPDGCFQRGDAASILEEIHEGDGIEFHQILGQVGQGAVPAVGDLDGAAVEFQCAQDGLQQGGLSGAVVSHQTDPAPIRNAPGDIREDRLFPKGETDVFQVDQILATPERWSWRRRFFGSHTMIASC